MWVEKFDQLLMILIFYKTDFKVIVLSSGIKLQYFGHAVLQQNLHFYPYLSLYNFIINDDLFI